MSNKFSGIDFDYMNAFYKPLDSDGPGMGTQAKDIMSNIKGTIAYGSALVVHEDDSSQKVQKNPGVLGNAYFLNTYTECDGEYEGDIPIRYVYISNRPTGEIPALSGLIPNLPTTPTGLIPGMMSNIERTNPSGLLNAMLPTSSDDSKCHEITLQTYEQQKNGKVTVGTDTHFMSKYDICKVDKKAFISDRSSICKTETFKSLEEEEELEELEELEEIDKENNYSKMPEDELMQLYLSSLTLLGLYLVLKFINKR